MLLKPMPEKKLKGGVKASEWKGESDTFLKYPFIYRLSGSCHVIFIPLFILKNDRHE